MYLSIINVIPLDNYKLQLVFENNEVKIFDVTPYLNTGKFKELQDPALFCTVRVAFDTIEWTNKLDIDPETLYEGSIPVVKN